MPDLASDLRALPMDRLVDLLLELAETDPAVERRLRLATRSDTGRIPELARVVDETLRTRRFLDYRAAITYATEAGVVVEALESAAEGPAAREVVPVIERALQHVVRVLHHSDDSAGVCGDVAQRLLAAHVVAARAGRPDPGRLLRWLIRFTFEDQDLFNPDVRDYAEALGDDGVASYRAEVQRRAEVAPDAFAPQEAQRCLALLDRDADAIVRTFGGALDSVFRFSAVAAAFREIGDDDAALSWARRGMQLPPTWQSRGLHDLAADLLARRGDAAAVVDLRLAGLRALPDATSYAALRAAAETAGQWPQLRPDALAVLRQRGLDPYVQAVLQDGDVDAAWQAVQERPGEALDSTEQQVAAARAQTHPADAVPYARRAIEQTLQTADRRAYRSAATQLRRLRELHERAGTPEEFDAYLGQVVQDNRRRPTFLAELRKAGLN
ncbi:MAG: DUF6880 family protein [Actinomycetes bacterium]